MPLPHLIGLLALLALSAMFGLPRTEPDPNLQLQAYHAASREGIASAIRAHVITELARRKAPDISIDMAIAVTPAENDHYQVEIGWAVYSTDGKKLGTILQKNTLPWMPGAENRTWEAAGQAAAIGIMKLLEPEEDGGA